MINILSYQQPLCGKKIKDWISFHTENEAEYSRIARTMVRYLTLDDETLYRIVLRPQSTAGGKRKKGRPDIVSVIDPEDKHK